MKHDKDGKLEGAAIIQVDYTLMFGTDALLTIEEAAAEQFDSKSRKYLSPTPTPFNSANLTRIPNGTITMQVDDKIDKLQTSADSDKEFASLRAAVQNIGLTCRPDICANAQLIAAGSDPTSNYEYKTLAQITGHLKTTRSPGLTFVSIDIDTSRLVIISDASFVNSRGSRSQLGFIALMVDD